MEQAGNSQFPSPFFFPSPPTPFVLSACSSLITHHLGRTSVSVVLALALVANTLPTVFGQGSSSPQPKVLWKLSTGGNITTRPLLNGGKIFVTSSDNNFYAINADSGAHVWNINGLQPGTTPTISKDGLSMFVNNYVSNPNSWPVSSLVSVNLDNGRQNWKYGGDPVGNQTMGRAVQQMGPAVLCADTGTLYSTSTFYNSAFPNASLNGVFPIDPDTGVPSGPAIQPPKYSVNDTCFWLPQDAITLSSDCTTIYGKSSGWDMDMMNMSAVNIKTGQVLWVANNTERVCPSYFPDTLSPYNDHVYVVSGCSGYFTTNTIYAYYAQTGILAWQYIGGIVPRNSVAFNAQPALSPDGAALFASHGDGNVYALNATDGQVLWSFRCAGVPSATPAVTSDGSTVIITTAGGSVHGVHAANGTEAWTYFTGSGIAAGVTLNDDDSVAYFGNDNGYIFALAISSC